MDTLIEFITAHWPFIVYAIISAVSTQTAKATIWTKEKCEGDSKLKSFYKYGRKTLPMHPVFMGALIGLIPGIPISDDVSISIASKSLYFAGSGVLSTWIFAVLKALAKKYGLSIDLPNEKSE